MYIPLLHACLKLPGVSHYNKHMPHPSLSQPRHIPLFHIHFCTLHIPNLLAIVYATKNIDYSPLKQ